MPLGANIQKNSLGSNRPGSFASPEGLIQEGRTSETVTIPLKDLTYGPCPYLNHASLWRVAEFSCNALPPAIYESLLPRGFRRSGTSFYRTICEGCDRCIPIRIDVENFRPSRSQRRVLRRNIDTQVSCDSGETSFREDRFRLYESYCRDRHGKPTESGEGSNVYSSFLVDSPLGSVTVTEYWTVQDGHPRLIGNGYLDVLPEGLSSVYFVWDTVVSRLSLGTYSILREIELARNLGKRWYYLGFWVPGSPVMDYKANFGPAQISRHDRWIPLTEEMRDELRGVA